MVIIRALSYPVAQFGQGMKHLYSLNLRSKQLGYVYDMAHRLIAAKGLKPASFTTIGNNLMDEISARGIVAKGTTLFGHPEEILSALNAALGKADVKGVDISKEDLFRLRITHSDRTPLKDKLLGLTWDRFIPRKSRLALSTLVKKEMAETLPGQALNTGIADLERHKEYLQQRLVASFEQVKQLEQGQDAYMAIVRELYKSRSSGDIMEDIKIMFDVVTAWSWKVIGHSPKSDAAGAVVVGPHGKIGMPYQYIIGKADLDIQTAPAYKLKRKTGKEGGMLAMSEAETLLEANDERGNFIGVREWDELVIREDIVIEESPEGGRKLYRRVILNADELVSRLVEGLLKNQPKLLRAGAAMLAKKIVSGVVSDQKLKNAFVELEEVTPAGAEVGENELIPLVVKGTTIQQVSISFRDQSQTDKKLDKARKFQEFCEKAGVYVGIVSQDPVRAIGMSRTTTLKPTCCLIKDVNNFAVRPQNHFIISIAGTRSYYIRSLNEVDEEGNIICLGALLVSNPDIIPGKMSPKDEAKLMARFQAGRIFADLASTGVMIKVIQREVDRLLSASLGPKLYHQIVELRRYDLLLGRKIEDATVMFADISGFTKLSDVLKDAPNRVMELLSNVFARLDPIIFKNGGHVDKHDGDCIMADFGVPFREPGDVDAAVRTAVEVQLELQRINLDEGMRAFYQTHHLSPLGITIGLNTGMVIAGNLGHEKSKIEYSVIGDSVNQAARLQHAIERGQVLIGERTFDLLSEGLKDQLVNDFNAYNQDLGALKSFIMTELAREGLPIDEADIDKKLERYLELYEDVTELDVFVPTVIFAKGKGAIPGYFVRWDRHAWRYQFLKAAGIELSEKSQFENQPLGVDETLAAVNAERDEKKRQELRIAFEGILRKHNIVG